MSDTNYEPQYAVPSTFLTGVADQARRLTESSGTLTTDEMLTALEGVAPKTDPVLQDKTITANGTYTADEGYDGLGAVTVEVPSGGAGSYSSSAVCIIPDIVRGIAESNNTVLFYSSTANGVLEEEE